MEINGKEISQELMEKAAACQTTEELLALAKESGIDLTAEQAEAYLSMYKSGELSDDELDDVAGGVVDCYCRSNHPCDTHKPCFLTTAVCEYLGKADDCEELTTLRAYRDGWLAKQPGGQGAYRGILSHSSRHRPRHEGVGGLRCHLRGTALPLHPSLPRLHRRGEKRGVQAALHGNGALRRGDIKRCGVN